MQKAAKEKSFLLWTIALAILFCAPSYASSTRDSHLKNRVEIFLGDAQNSTDSGPFDPAKHVENYDPSWGVASDSSVAPKGTLGRGSTANLSKGTTLPRNLREQLAVEEVTSRPTAGVQLRRITMTDPRWPASDGWVKMQHIVQSGGREGPVNVHYVFNTITGQIDDLKIVLPGVR